MNGIIKNVPMLIAACYFFYLWSIISLASKTPLATSFRWNYFLSVNITTVLVLTAMGLVRFIYFMKPSWIVFTSSLIFCMYLTIRKHWVTKKIYFISFLVSLTIVTFAAIVPAGLIELNQVGLNFHIVWRWFVISLLITLFTLGAALKKREKRESRRTRKINKNLYEA